MNNQTKVNDKNRAEGQSRLNDGLGSDLLTKALIAAGTEMENELNWFFEETGMEEFVTTIKKHIEPLINVSAYKQQRIASLRAEADALERDS